MNKRWCPAFVVVRLWSCVSEPCVCPRRVPSCVELASVAQRLLLRVLVQAFVRQRRRQRFRVRSCKASAFPSFVSCIETDRRQSETVQAVRLRCRRKPPAGILLRRHHHRRISWSLSPSLHSGIGKHIRLTSCTRQRVHITGFAS